MSVAGESLLDRELRRERELFDLVDLDIKRLKNRICGFTDLSPSSHRTAISMLNAVQELIALEKP